MTKHEWRISYRRRGWQSPQRRFFQTEAWARGYMRKLHGYDPRREDLEPFEYVKIQRREVGEWGETT